MDYETKAVTVYLSVAADSWRKDKTYLCNTVNVHPAGNFKFFFQTNLQLPWIIKSESSLNFHCSFLDSIT